VLGFFRLLVYALNDDLFRAFISEQEFFMEFASDVINALVVSENALRNSVSNFADEAFHVEVLEHASYDGMRQ
jgi:hypothetical protein